MISVNYLLALILTLISELTVLRLFGYKRKIELVSVILVNLITNPLLNYIFLSNNYFGFLTVNIFTILLMEFIVVLVEWRLLVFALEKNAIKLFVLSLVMNFCSFMLGVILFF